MSTMIHFSPFFLIQASLTYLNRAILNLKKKSCHFKVFRDDLLKKSMCNLHESICF